MCMIGIPSERTESDGRGVNSSLDVVMVMLELYSMEL